MMTKTAIAVLIIFLALSYSEIVTADSADCYDACSTACVQRNTRLMLRCDRKCQIRCGPDSEVNQHGYEVIKD